MCQTLHLLNFRMSRKLNIYISWLWDFLRKSGLIMTRWVITYIMHTLLKLQRWNMIWIILWTHERHPASYPCCWQWWCSYCTENWEWLWYQLCHHWWHQRLSSRRQPLVPPVMTEVVVMTTSGATSDDRGCRHDNLWCHQWWQSSHYVHFGESWQFENLQWETFRRIWTMQKSISGL